MVFNYVINARKNFSSSQIARDLGMRQPTVWLMMIRIRKVIKGSQAELLSGIVEMNKTHIEGKPRKRNNDKGDGVNLPTIKRGMGKK